MTPCILAVLIAATAPSAAAVAPSPAAATNVRVFVFGFQTELIERRLVLTAERAVVEVAAGAGLDVVSQQDLSAIVDIEATRQASGCTSDGACLAEIADAMGASRVVTGLLTQLDDGGIDVALTLLERNGTAVLARASGTARGTADLKKVSADAARQLFGLTADVEARGTGGSGGGMLLGIGAVTTAVGLVGLVGLIPLVQAQLAAGDARTAADAFALSGDGASFDDLAAANDAHAAAAAGWNSWGATAVVAGGIIVTAGLIAIGVGAVAD